MATFAIFEAMNCCKGLRLISKQGMFQGDKAALEALPHQQCLKLDMF